MLAYAANRPDPAGRRPSPNVMLFILAVHIAAIAALMSAKMDVRRITREPPTIRVALDPVKPKPIDTKSSKPTPQTTKNWVSHPVPQVDTHPAKPIPFDLGGTTTDPGSVGPTTIPEPLPPLPIPQPPLPVRLDPQLLTPATQLRPPYPASKLASEEEADLHLRLSIGVDGHVTAVEPIGRADPVFLDAARRYLIAHWRYRPASVDGRAIATVMTITLSFRLDS